MSQVNEPTTSAVTATTLVVGSAPAVALGQVYQSTSTALATAARDAAAAQAHGNVVQTATTFQGVALLMGLDAATTARGILKILRS